MMRVLRMLVLLVTVLIPASLGAQLGGTWDIMASFDLAQAPCAYTGTGTLMQMESQVNGPVHLTLDPNNPGGCPADMVGVLVATVTGSRFQGTIDGTNDPGGDRGMATVTGTITVPPASQSTSAAATTISGTTATTSGPFSGTNGSFSGQLRPITMSATGPLVLAALAAVLLGGSTLLLVRRRV